MKQKSFLLVCLLMMFLSACNGITQIKEKGQPAATMLVDQHSCRLMNRDAICGYLPVYENCLSQSGRMINLNIVVIKASDPNPEPDPIVFLAGGPGEAATESKGNIEFLLWLAKGQRDIVLVDQRGTGGSHQVLVPPSPDFSGLDGAELEAQFAAWVEKTLDEMDMDPRYYTTSVAMDNLDAVRQAQRVALICKYLPHGETPEGAAPQTHSQKPILLFNTHDFIENASTNGLDTSCLTRLKPPTFKTPD